MAVLSVVDYATEVRRRRRVVDFELRLGATSGLNLTDVPGQLGHQTVLAASHSKSGSTDIPRGRKSFSWCCFSFFILIADYDESANTRI